MKNTTLGQMFAVGALSLGGFAQTLLADGPADLEALSKRARAVAEDKGEISKKAAVEAIAEVKEELVKEADPVEAVEAVEAVEPLDPAKRAEKLGLLANISKEVSSVTALLDGKRIWGEVVESKIGSMLLDLSAENDLDLTDPDSPAAQFAVLFQEEFIVATGQGTVEQLENALAFNGVSDKYQMALMVRLLTMGMDDELDLGALSGPFGPIIEAIADDPDLLANLISAAEMPPVLLAARVSDDMQRDTFAAGLGMGQAMALGLGADAMPYLKNAEAEVAGISFRGLAVDGKILVKFLQEEKGLLATLENYLDSASAQDLMKSLSEKNFTLLGGVSDEAVYLYLGSSADDIPLVGDVADGMAASPHFAFADSYLEENIISLFWMNEEVVEVSSTGQKILGNYIDGLRLGLKDNDAIENGENLEALLKKLEGLEASYLLAGQSQAVAGVSFLRADGFHSESYGGYIHSDYDLETPHQMGSGGAESFLTVQSVMNQEIGQLGQEYFETTFETVYEMATLAAGMEERPEKLEAFLRGFQLFDEEFKSDALALWQSLGATEAGVGSESIFELDLAGSWPTVPGVLERIIKDGLAPRVSYVRPVTDREKLAESWTGIEGALGKFLQTTSENIGGKIPMQKPMSSQNDGLKTWFFALPTMTDDFIPSVTLDDEVMVMSSSKERAVALAQAAKKGGEGLSGVAVEMNFDPLLAFLSNWLELMEENPEAILVNEKALAFFLEHQETIGAMLVAMDEFDSWRMHAWLEDGQLRRSLHLKTK